jgi:hypothetical protein
MNLINNDLTQEEETFTWSWSADFTIPCFKCTCDDAFRPAVSCRHKSAAYLRSHPLSCCKLCRATSAFGSAPVPIADRKDLQALAKSINSDTFVLLHSRITVVHVDSIDYRRGVAWTYLGTTLYLAFRRPPLQASSIHRTGATPASRRFPTVAIPAGPAPTTTALYESR